MLTFVPKKIKLFFQKTYCNFTQKKRSIIGHNSYGASLASAALKHTKFQHILIPI